MRQTFKTPIVGCVNQKGGVGKSTLTTLLANIFYFQKDLSVAIIDADFPQQTIFKRREENAAYIRSKPWLKELSEQMYAKRPPIQVFAIQPHEVEATIQSIQEHFDIIFLDIAGTLNQVDIQATLWHINYFFIPVLQDEDSFKSTKDFYKLAAKSIFPHSTAFKACHFVLNKLPPNNKEAKYRKKIAKLGGTTLQNNLYNNVVYERTFRSTLLPIPTPNEKKMHFRQILRLHALADEIYAICFDTTEEKINPPLLQIIPTARANVIGNIAP